MQKRNLGGIKQERETNIHTRYKVLQADHTSIVASEGILQILYVCSYFHTYIRMYAGLQQENCPVLLSPGKPSGFGE